MRPPRPPPAPPAPPSPQPDPNPTFCHWTRKLRVLHLGGYRHAVLGIAILYGPPACKLSSISGYRFIVRILQKELLRTRSSSRKCSERRPKEARQYLELMSAEIFSTRIPKHIGSSIIHSPHLSNRHLIKFFCTSESQQRTTFLVGLLDQRFDSLSTWAIRWCAVSL